MDRPKYKLQKGFNLSLCQSNLGKLREKSDMAKTQHVMLNIMGSSHVGKPEFVRQVQEQFHEGVDTMNKFLHPGLVMGFPGGGIGDEAVRTEILRQLKAVAAMDSYQGQICVLVLGTNDASKHGGSDKEKQLEAFRKMCKDFYLKLLEIPKLFLMPTSLLPRGKQDKYPERNPNMLPSSEVIREVCKEIRKDVYPRRIRFLDLSKDVATASELVSHPIKGILKDDNVHLTPLGNSLVVRNLFTSVNRVPSGDLNVELIAKPKPNKRAKKRKNRE